MIFNRFRPTNDAPRPLALAIILAAFCLVAVLAHTVLVPIGLALHNSEWSAFLLAADSFRSGKITAFPFQNDYGGLTVTYFRTIWSALWDQFDHSKWGHVTGHMTFSYWVSPALTVLTAFYLVRAYCSHVAALVVALVAALGIQSLAYIYGDDFYPLMIWLSFIVLAMRGKTENPFLEFSMKRLFLASVLLGHGLYATRAFQLFVVVFFFPWGWVRQEVKQFKAAVSKSVQKWERGIVYTGVALLVSGLAIEVFGRELGTVGGKLIKLDGEPNLKIGAALIFLIWAKRNRNRINPNVLKRAVTVVLGIFVGLLPEILHWISKGRLVTTRGFASHDFPMMMQIAGMVPETLTSLVSGNIRYRALTYREQGIGQVACVGLFVWATFVFARQVARDRGLAHIAALAILCIFAYCRVNTQFTEVAPIRYMMTLYPYLFISLGILVDHVRDKRKTAAVILAAVLAAVCVHHVGSRYRFAQGMRSSGYVDTLYKIAETYQSQDVDIVISDDFWFASNIAVASKSRPMFWGSWQGFGPIDAHEKAKSATRAGILLESRESTDPKLKYPRKKVDLMGRSWTLKPVAKIADRELYIGTVEP